MRLLHAENLTFHDYFDDGAPRYAILSHTWSGEETSYQDALRVDSRASSPVEVMNTVGWRKIKKTCEWALQLNLKYVWVDTCCIDKGSSAELSEAINSMFQWYEKAHVCFAYLSDVPSSAKSSKQEIDERFIASRWFTRGWTLQELIAPSEVVFFASDWSVIGTRTEMAGVLTLLTGIDMCFFENGKVIATNEVSSEGAVTENPPSGAHMRLWEMLEMATPRRTEDGTSIRCKLRGASVAERMSWAARRQTSRIEDLAYCLLGVFGVNMPLIYGEGDRAFMRLQEEIMRQNDDMTIFAWQFRYNGIPMPPLPTYRGFMEDHPWKVARILPAYERDCPAVGFLADSPASFRGCGNIICSEAGHDGAPITFVNQRLQLTLPLSDDEQPFLLLPCRNRDDPLHLIAIPLVRYGSNTFSRARFPSNLVSHQAWYRWQTSSVKLLTSLDEYKSRPEIPDYSFWLRRIPEGFETVAVYPTTEAHFSKRIIVPQGKPFAERRMGDEVNAAISLRSLKDRHQGFFFFFHTKKLYSRGILGMRPTQTSYKVVPWEDGQELGDSLCEEVERTLSKPLQYGIVDNGLLYAHVKKRLCLDKTLFAIQIEHERSGIRGWWLRSKIDYSTRVSGGLRDLYRSSRILKVLITSLKTALSYWETVIGGLVALLGIILYVGVMLKAASTWPWLRNLLADKTKTGSLVAVETITLIVVMYLLIPYLSYPFPRVSSTIRRLRLPLAVCFSTGPIYLLLMTQKFVAVWILVSVIIIRTA